MADETRVVRTAGVYGTFVLPGLVETSDGPADLTITPEGTEVSFEQWKSVAKAAVENQVIVRLDEDFPAELYAADAQERADAAENEQLRVAESPADAGNQPGAGTVVDGTDTKNETSGGRRGARNGG